jgi:pyruvate/2-oxoglutarate dehydrogenase complex dihydrolipoamide dehydrogenase (E3) component
MTQENYDAIVIGLGQSGPSLAARLVKEGLRTVIWWNVC